jgi:hypothetical protein
VIGWSGANEKQILERGTDVMRHALGRSAIVLSVLCAAASGCLDKAFAQSEQAPAGRRWCERRHTHDHRRPDQECDGKKLSRIAYN